MKKFKHNLLKTILLSLIMVLFPIGFVKADNTLRIHPTNSRYFTDGSGKAIYLTGSHTWTNLIDDDTSYPPTAFNYDGYLDFMEEHNHNFMRMWTWEQSKYTYGDGFRYSAPQPWSRTGPGNALDGRPKFDLTRFNEEYFSRLRSRVIAAGKKGIYVSIMLFEGHGAQRSKIPWCWDGHPLNAENNINGIDGNPDEDDRGLEIYTLEIPEITKIQEAYVQKVIDAVNDLDNVLYEIINEAGPYSTQWQYHMINYIKDYEATKPKQHPVGMTFQYKGGTNAALFDSPADWISPNQEGGYRDNPPAADGSKVIISDTDHLWGIGGNQQWVWKSFLRGLNPIYMDPYGDPPGDESIRDSMGYTLDYAERMNLASMIPMNKLSSTKYCLANPGSEYLIYQPDSGSFTVKLNAGTYSYEWFNPDTGAVVESGTVTVNDGNKSYTPPFSGDAVLYLRHSSDDSVISQTNWTLKYVDSEELIGENGAAANAFDSNINTIWHTKWFGENDPQPHEIQIDLGEYYDLTGLRYLPRQDGGDNGRIKDYEFYTSANGTNWNFVLAGAFADNTNEQEITFEEQTGVKYVRLKTLSAYDNDPWTTIAEINLLGVLGASPCIEAWTCDSWSAWSECVSNQQSRTRTCTDANACGTTDNKPLEIETQSCESPPTYGISNFINLVSDWLKLEPPDLESDVNNDGIVNTRDLGIMMSNWQ